jgi:Cu-Zn family superoxide dismutase
MSSDRLEFIFALFSSRTLSNRFFLRPVVFLLSFKFKQTVQMSNPAFLESYARVRNEAICKVPLHARQVVVWTVRNGQWVWRHPNSQPKSESWCKNALTLLAQPDEVERLKKELLNTQDGFNGVYKHKTQNLFAIVYDPAKRESAVAFFPEGPNQVAGHVIFTRTEDGVAVKAFFSQLPPGEHGFHIHKAGDLRGEGCKRACDHYHVGPPSQHGGAPGRNNKDPRHTGDLGNIFGPPFHKRYELKGVDLSDLYGRSVVVHADQDDLGYGDFPDSKTTGHSGSRIACAIIGRSLPCQ